MKLTREQVAARREHVVKGMTLTNDGSGGAVLVAKSRIGSSFDEAIARMEKARAMTGEIAAALRQRH